jgi:hypothetical protein
MVLTWHVASDLPLIGTKVERLLADLICTSLQADHAFTLHCLQARGAVARLRAEGDAC